MPHKRKQYRILDREQRVEWEPEEGELMDDDEFLEEEDASNDSFVVADDDEDAIWGTSDDDFEAELISADEGSEQPEEEEEEEEDLPTHVTLPLRRTRAVLNPPPAAAASKAPARRRNASSSRRASATAPCSPMRRFIVPKPAAAAPPYRPSAQRQHSKVEIETPDGRIITVRRSKYSTTLLPTEEIENDIWTQFERSRTTKGRSTRPMPAVAEQRQHKPRGAIASHALIAHAMPRRSFQYADVSTPPPPPPPLSRASTLPAPASSMPPPLASLPRKPAADFYVPATPPKPLPPAGRTSSAPVIVVAAPSSSPQSIPQSPPRPATPGASPQVSSPFKGDRNERATLKRTVAERVKSMLRPVHKEGRITDEQFKAIARATTAAFVAEKGEGADLRAHLRRVAQQQLGASLLGD